MCRRVKTDWTEASADVIPDSVYQGKPLVHYNEVDISIPPFQYFEATVRVGDYIYAIPVKEIWPKGTKDVHEFREKGSRSGNIYRIGLVHEIFAVQKQNIPDKFLEPLFRVRWLNGAQWMFDNYEDSEARHLSALSPYEHVLIEDPNYVVYVTCKSSTMATTPICLIWTTMTHDTDEIPIIHWVKICYNGCRRGNIYNTVEDELRWCSKCRLWVHAACSEILDLTAEDIPAWLDSNDQAYILHDWDETVDPSLPTGNAIAALPIARYPMCGTPHSLEKVIVLAREKLTWAEDSGYQLDYDKFIEQAKANPDPAFVKKGVEEEIREALKNSPVFYYCPKCCDFSV
ncbi:uncharacterized protein STEHIDRAFT_154758 [Stereum hirsutum FP-91666 SS1]|uniref:uncharacterized protein n=1 Tax=Stereum hirsutum (strain FP-91666) TaxID=721885 RepID=UPI000440FE05|nr:uncharacterized protein STEHIDRAFT_154758 [Stereum hirsutum FP-91666 SS1]EIM89068.1 hypothetical protein STEHIDRAFT_154758 [Stereum hirsutum FP-91666 SS1]